MLYIFDKCVKSSNVLNLYLFYFIIYNYCNFTYCLFYYYVENQLAKTKVNGIYFFIILLFIIIYHFFIILLLLLCRISNARMTSQWIKNVFE